MDQEATQLEKQHVHAVYESTAPYFSDLQSKAWPRVRQFLQEQKPGSLVADIGDPGWAVPSKASPITPFLCRIPVLF